MSNLKQTILKIIENNTLTGQELFYAIDKLGIGDPGSELCQKAGIAQSGAVHCDRCSLGPTPAGCMSIIKTAQNLALSKQAYKAKSKLYLLLKHV